MESKSFKEKLQLLGEAAEVLNKLPVEVRLAAFHMLERGVPGAHSPKTESGGKGKKDAAVDAPLNVEDAGSFFASHSHDKAADNAKLIAAYLYSQYGSEPFSVEDVRQLAKKVGVTIPSRVDATLNAAQDEGKKLFNGAGHGKYRPTVNGETYLKMTYNIKKGTKQRSAS